MICKTNTILATRLRQVDIREEREVRAVKRKDRRSAISPYITRPTGRGRALLRLSLHYILV